MVGAEIGFQTIRRCLKQLLLLRASAMIERAPIAYRRGQLYGRLWRQLDCERQAIVAHREALSGCVCQAIAALPSAVFYILKALCSYSYMQ